MFSLHFHFSFEKFWSEKSIEIIGNMSSIVKSSKKQNKKREFALIDQFEMDEWKKEIVEVKLC